MTGTVGHVFADGVLLVVIDGGVNAGQETRTVYVRPEELPGAKKGDRVTIRMEVTSE